MTDESLLSFLKREAEILAIPASKFSHPALKIRKISQLTQSVKSLATRSRITDADKEYLLEQLATSTKIYQDQVNN